MRRAVASGELREGTDPLALAATVESFLWGVSTQARDGVAHEVLHAAVDHVMGVWDAHRAGAGAPGLP